jgi:nucleoside-diphosphate-sugar epimerase
VKVFITGNEGKIGGRAQARLEQAGHEVVGYDIARDAAQDILNPQALKYAMAGCDMVVHCAAIPHPRHGSPGRYFDINVHGSKFVFEMAARHEVRRVIYTSSTGYYGCDVRGGQILPLYLPIDERHPPAPIGPFEGALEIYNTSKVMAEQLLFYYGSNHAFEAVVLRCAPANKKERQYRGAFDWRAEELGKSWKRGCLFSNCHPAYAAQAIQRAVEAEGPFWGEAFNITDRYTHESIDVHEFVREEYPLVPVRKGLGEHDSLITPRKAMEWLGFEPCEELK